MHIALTIGDRVIIGGGSDAPSSFNLLSSTGKISDIEVDLELLDESGILKYTEQR
jgi:hypothetical protein